MKTKENIKGIRYVDPCGEVYDLPSRYRKQGDKLEFYTDSPNIKIWKEIKYKDILVKAIVSFYENSKTKVHEERTSAYFISFKRFQISTLSEISLQGSTIQKIRDSSVNEAIRLITDGLATKEHFELLQNYCVSCNLKEKRGKGEYVIY